jgi:triosephosphate isomerase
MKRRPLIAANWKMHLGRVEEALGFVRSIRPPLSHLDNVNVVLCAPFTVLAELSEILGRSAIEVGAQDVHWEEGGAHTGEISARMLAGLCRYVIVGHSERRATGSAADGDDAVNRKVRAALSADLTPMICVGESLEHHERGDTDSVVGGQVAAAFAGLDGHAARRCVIAYEPIWAIGSGRAATPAEANSVMGLSIRGRLARQFGEHTAGSVRMLYGGSVTAENIANFMTMPHIDGALVGGASLDAKGFVELVRNASQV